jgi:hypothetical protein
MVLDIPTLKRYIFFIFRTGAGQVPDGFGHGGGDARLPRGGTLPRHRPLRPQGQKATRHCQVGVI